MWQALNPKLWFDNPQKDEPKPSDSLMPFYQDEKRNPWTSDACRYVMELHYSYRDLQETEKGGKEVEGVGSLDELRKRINKQYGSARSRMLSDTSGTTGLKNDYIVNVVYDR